jgi:hypothetical protein
MTILHFLSKQGKPLAKGHYWLSPLALVLVLGGLFAFNITQHPTQARAAGSVTVWLQVMDSCEQALPHAKFTLVAPNGTTISTLTSAGTRRVTVSSGTCPLQRGNCVTVPTGCLHWTITSPTSGTYKIKEKSTSVSVSGTSFLENPAWPTASTGFVHCNGGSACKSESATFTITSGVVKGTTTNIYPDGKTSMYPSGSTFSGTQKNPIVFHNFGLGNGSCDGDKDKDDFLTGSPSTHCDNDSD